MLSFPILSYPRGRTTRCLAYKYEYCHMFSICTACLTMSDICHVQPLWVCSVPVKYLDGHNTCQAYAMSGLIFFCIYLPDAADIIPDVLTTTVSSAHLWNISAKSEPSSPLHWMVWMNNKWSAWHHLALPYLTLSRRILLLFKPSPPATRQQHLRLQHSVYHLSVTACLPTAAKPFARHVSVPHG